MERVKIFPQKFFALKVGQGREELQGISQFYLFYILQEPLWSSNFKAPNSSKVLQKQLTPQLILNNNNNNMSGRGKGKSSKKAVSRSAIMLRCPLPFTIYLSYKDSHLIDHFPSLFNSVVKKYGAPNSEVSVSR